jgi:pyruvate dehydrogenase E2 component (dihydrolipoamide acetyltransferase)
MAEIETDKATMDYESFNAGTILYLGVPEGQAVKVNDVLAIVGNKGEDYTALLSGASSAGASGGKAEEPKAEKAAAPTTAAPAIDTSGIKAEVVLMPR